MLISGYFIENGSRYLFGAQRSKQNVMQRLMDDVSPETMLNCMKKLHIIQPYFSW